MGTEVVAVGGAVLFCFVGNTPVAPRPINVGDAGGLMSVPANVGPAERLICDDGEGDRPPPLLPGVRELLLFGLRNTGSPVTSLGSRKPLRRLRCAAVSENPRVFFGGTLLCDKVRLLSTVMLSFPGVNEGFLQTPEASRSWSWDRPWPKRELPSVYRGLSGEDVGVRNPESVADCNPLPGGGPIVLVLSRRSNDSSTSKSIVLTPVST